MRITVREFVISLSMLAATSAAAQESWEYDRDAIDGPTAFVTAGEYALGAICIDDTPNFFIDFPREGLPKSDDANVRIKFATDVPQTQASFSVSAIILDWEMVGDKASIWFYGGVANDWIEEMASARTSAFIAIETRDEPARLIFEQWFSLRGSTATLRDFASDCGE